MTEKRTEGMAPDSASLPEDKYVARGSMPAKPEERKNIKVNKITEGKGFVFTDNTTKNTSFPIKKRKKRTRKNKK